MKHQNVIKIRSKNKYKPVSHGLSALGFGLALHLVTRTLFGNSDLGMQFAIAIVCAGIDYTACKLSKSHMGLFNHAMRKSLPYAAKAAVCIDDVTEKFERHGLDRAC